MSRSRYLKDREKIYTIAMITSADEPPVSDVSIPVTALFEPRELEPPVDMPNAVGEVRTAETLSFSPGEFMLRSCSSMQGVVTSVFACGYC
jgi:hypothetical protein